MISGFWHQVLICSLAVHVVGMLIRLTYHLAGKLVNPIYSLKRCYLRYSEYEVSFIVTAQEVFCAVFLWELIILFDGMRMFAHVIISSHDDEGEADSESDDSEFINSKYGGSFYHMFVRRVDRIVSRMVSDMGLD